MAFDQERAGRMLVEIVDVLNGGRTVGMGFRLVGDAIATSCRCLPRPGGQVVFPDPDQPGVLVLVRVRAPGSDRAAFAIVTTADPCSGLALLRSASPAGLTVPDELNATVPIEELIADLLPAAPELAPPREGPVLVLTDDGVWVKGRARSTTVSVDDGAGRIGPGSMGAPVFDEEGRAIGLVTGSGDAGLEATLCSLTEHLPGWALRRAAATGRS